MAFPKSFLRTSAQQTRKSKGERRTDPDLSVADARSLSEPLLDYDADVYRKSFVEPVDEPTQMPPTTPLIPPRPENNYDDYLMPMLSQNERHRLSMYWYHTRGIREDAGLLQRIQDKVDLVKDFIGWDFAICGLSDSDTFERLITAGIPRATVPRRESTCSHTINQKPGEVLVLNDLANDWRFQQSPPVKAGLKSYAGTTLHLRNGDDDDEVALGSLCVASPVKGLSLSQSQRAALVRFADMVVMEIVNQCRWNRQQQQQRMNDLVDKAFTNSSGEDVKEKILQIVKDMFPEAEVMVVGVVNQAVPLSSGQIISLSEVGDQGFWEDGTELDSVILSQNHRSLTTTRFVRAICSRVAAAQSTQQLLVVATKDVRLIFDDVDIWFVQRCSSVLTSAFQASQLAEALRTKENFLRGVAHQFRTPIHGVLGSVDLLEELAPKDLIQAMNALEVSPTNDEPVNTAEVLRTIRSSSQELMSTVNNIIKLHRWAENSTPDRTETLVNLAELEAQIIDTVLPQAHSSKTCFMFDNQLPHDIRGIMSDMDLLRECLQSVVLNALQATPAGDVVMTVSTPEDRSMLCFDVQDSGCGISDQDHERIFGAYEKCQSTTPGIGLGLFLASKLVTVLGGNVSLLSSVEGQGSHFRVALATPTFSCSPEQPVPASTGQFHVVESTAPALIFDHFKNFLLRSGLIESSAPDESSLLVEYSAEDDTFHSALRKAESYGGGLCLIPSNEHLGSLKSLHPQTIFAAGPFTSQRLQEILTQLRRPQPIHRASIFADPSSTLQLLTTETSCTGQVRVSPTSSSSVLPLRTRANEPQFPRCLLVDDNAVNLRLLQMYCAKRQYPHISTIDGLEAIQAYKDNATTSPFDLILLDLQMPRCDGLTACASIRAFETDNAMRPARIFILTGQDSPNDRTQSMAAGANEFFVKPVGFKVLDGNISKYFRDGT